MGLWGYGAMAPILSDQGVCTKPHRQAASAAGHCLIAFLPAFMQFCCRGNFVAAGYTISLMHPPSSHRLGRRAEWAALLLLVAKGYRPRHRRWRGGGGELDLVMQQHGEIVFVEVKARSSDQFGGAVAAIDGHKKKTLIRASSAYLSRFGLWEKPCRFDVVTFERKGGLVPWSVRHYRNAFQPDLGRMM